LPELLRRRASTKDAAEHVTIADLERNALFRVREPAADSA
jgi:anthranilate/para-aminobenzoate synthase component I